MRTEGRALPPVTPFSDSLTAPIRPPPPKEHEGSHGERQLEASHANPSSEESPTTWPPRVAGVRVWPAALAPRWEIRGYDGG